MPRGRSTPKPKETNSYKHPESDSPLRPDVGTQPNFPKQKRKPPKTYRYDSSLSPALEWDDNPAREKAEALIAEILEAESLEDAKAAAAKLKVMSQPFLNWAGKAERLSFDVPTLPLFVHERLSTKAIIQTLLGHKKGGEQLNLFDLFGDPQRSIVDQVLKAYEHRDKWVNRMILGDSLQVMNSLLEYEGLGGQVQMIYMDPPYGVQFGSNFQPFVRKRDVKHNDDDAMTREPEMVQAYRDTWELGLHSYLAYLRDRLLLARELLTESGSIFVQISDENVHHVRELMDDVFGRENFCSVITFKKTGGQADKLIASVADYLLWYSRDRSKVQFNQTYVSRYLGDEGSERYNKLLLKDGTVRNLKSEEFDNPNLIPDESKVFRLTSLVSQGLRETTSVPWEYQGKKYYPGNGQHWKVTLAGLDKLAQANRIGIEGNRPAFKRFLNDFPVVAVSSMWQDTQTNFAGAKLYVVQTSLKTVQRCILMTTEPGDLVLDPTCGSGTSAYIAEQWGRRWIAIDVSRVPLALARQRLLTATFPYYELKDGSRGPAGGFVYKRKQNKKGDEVGGIVPHITLKSIANDEPPAEEVLVDRPRQVSNYTRVTGPFTVEAVIPTPVETESTTEEVTPQEDASDSFDGRMLEVLRQSPLLRLEGNRTLTFEQVRKPTKTLYLSAEAMVPHGETTNGTEPTSQPVALVFGPENGQVVERTVNEAAREARNKDYAHLYVIGFAIHPNARQLIEHCEELVGIPATYVQATPDLLMGDLLKNMRSSQIFSVCGLPEIKLHSTDDGKHQVELLGIDVFDPGTMETYHRNGNDVPAWFLDTDYNGLCFHVCQAFFPRTKAWGSLKKALQATHDEAVWDHLAGTTSAPFEPGDHHQIAVKVIDDRGNELLVVAAL